MIYCSVMHWRERPLCALPIVHVYLCHGLDLHIPVPWHKSLIIVCVQAFHRVLLTPAIGRDMGRLSAHRAGNYVAIKMAARCTYQTVRHSERTDRDGRSDRQTASPMDRQTDRHAGQGLFQWTLLYMGTLQCPSPYPSASSSIIIITFSISPQPPHVKPSSTLPQAKVQAGKKLYFL